MTRQSIVTMALAAVALGAAPATLAAVEREQVACGDAITQDTRLTANLVDCPGVGLVIGADGITLDLNGHRIDGDGAGEDFGILVQGRRRVTIEGGAVRGFTEGVLVDNSSDVEVRRLTSAEQDHGGIAVGGSRDVLVVDNVVRDSGAGIIVSRSESVLVRDNHVSSSVFGGIPVFESHRARVVGNTVTACRNDAGIGLLAGSSQSEVAGNRLSRNGAGVVLNEGASGNVVAGNSLANNESGVIVDVRTHDNRLLENVIKESFFEGIAVVGSDGNLIARNRVTHNGGPEAAGGIAVIPWPDDPAQTSDDNAIVENAAIDNSGDGFHVGPGQAGNLVRANVANRNTGLGIFAGPGTIDGGGNHAARNGDAAQCVGVACGA
jgi:parallel beta-helix repeat protein